MDRSDLQDKSVLVVDPHDGAGLLQLRMAKQIGFGSGSVAETVIEAVDILKEDVFSLVILDFDTDGGEGLTLLDHIRAGYPGWKTKSGTPFLLTTGRADREVVLAARDKKVDALLLKPFSMSQFEEKIRGAMLA